MPAPYTDLLNEAIDDVAATLTAVSGLRVVTDPTRLVPNCVFLLAPSFTTYGGNGNIVTMDFPLKVVGSGPAPLLLGHSTEMMRRQCQLSPADQTAL